VLKPSQPFTAFESFFATEPELYSWRPVQARSDRVLTREQRPHCVFDRGLGLIVTHSLRAIAGNTGSFPSTRSSAIGGNPVRSTIKSNSYYSRARRRSARVIHFCSREVGHENHGVRYPEKPRNSGRAISSMPEACRQSSRRPGQFS